MNRIIRKPDSDLEYCAQYDCSIDPNEIINVLAQVPGEADGFNWHWIVQMKSKKFRYITGWCDYTGWGCQDGGEASIEVSTARKACAFAPEREEWAGIGIPLHKLISIIKDVKDRFDFKYRDIPF